MYILSFLFLSSSLEMYMSAIPGIFFYIVKRLGTAAVHVVTLEMHLKLSNCWDITVSVSALDLQCLYSCAWSY